MFGPPHARLLIPLASALLVLTGCSGGDDGPSGGGSSQQVPVDERPPAKAEAIESGFGQRGTKVVAVAVVKNQSPTDGQNLQITFNLLGPGKQQVASVSRTLVFAQGDDTQVAVGLGDLSGLDVKKIAEVAVTTTIDNADVDLATPDVTVKIDSLKPLRGGLGARISATNEGDADVAGVLLSVACRNQSGDLIGGGIVQAPAVASGKTVKVAARDLVVSGRADTCEATPAPQ